MSESQLPRAPKRDRPCDSCRRRKSRCVIEEHETECILCRFHAQDCTYIEEPLVRKRKSGNDDTTAAVSKKRVMGNSPVLRKDSKTTGRVIKTNQGSGVEEYDDLEGASLLKKTLGLKNLHHSRYLGPTCALEPLLLGYATNDVQIQQGTIRRTGPLDVFILLPDPGTQAYEEELQDIEAIEEIVAPYGKALILMYFRIVHPSFSILHKEVFLEKYNRSYREFLPPLLAAVYLLALQYWAFNDELSDMRKPDMFRLESLARKSLQDTIHRPKLSTVQAGILLLQYTEGDPAELTAQMISVGYSLGLHLDATDWNIPDWEKGLRKRLGWALYMQDKWDALSNGRPPLIASCNWSLQPVTIADFPENAAHEDAQEGSSEVETGIVMFDRMVALSEILTELLEEVVSAKGARDIKNAGNEEVTAVLEKVKSIQIRLKEWFCTLPDCLSMDSPQVMKLSSVGSLRLAYFATEMTLHRRLLIALSRNRPTHLNDICRTAARERFAGALDFMQSLKPQHLQSFWYFASAANFALIGTFGTLLCATATNVEEKEWSSAKLKEYRFILKINSQIGAKYMKSAIQMLDANTAMLSTADSHVITPENRPQLTQVISTPSVPYSHGEHIPGSESTIIDRYTAEGSAFGGNHAMKSTTIFPPFEASTEPYGLFPGIENSLFEETNWNPRSDNK